MKKSKSDEGDLLNRKIDSTDSTDKVTYIKMRSKLVVQKVYDDTMKSQRLFRGIFVCGRKQL